MKKTSFPMVSILLCMIVLVTLLSGCIRPSLEWVEMRDGVKLATDVYVQKNQQPHGVLLVRTPYNKNLLRLNGINWAENGWPTVIQDMRGRFASQGNDTVFFTDYADGFDTANWIVDQPWSNDKIATFGGSALGICQYFMAGANPSALACQFIQVATPNMYKHAMYWGGEFRESLVVRWLEGQGSTDVLPDIWAHENFSLEFWTNVTLEDNWQDVHVPAIHIGGWYDIFTQGTIDGFMGYQYLGGSGAQGKSKLILGPWTHGGAKNVQQGELRYPENCKDTFSDALFWQMVNEYTMGINGTYDEWPAVYYYIMGDTSNSSAPGNEWRESDVWPPVFTETEWFFHDTGELTTIPPSSGDSLGFVYDPLDPVPTEGGGNLKIKAGPYDQRSVENRSDVLIFTSPVLSEPYEATGPIKARLYVSSNQPDTDFTVKLTDVYPDGRSMLITDGIVRMRNRNYNDQWEFMSPGTVYEVEVDLWSSSYVWNTGHQIRVAVSSSNYPRFLNNPNTIEGIHANMTYVLAHNTVYVDSMYPSALILPESASPAVSGAPVFNSMDVIDDDKKVVGEVVCEVVDPEGDDVYVLVSWGDGRYSGWMGPYASGKSISISHQYQKSGIYQIQVITKDVTGAHSAWMDSMSLPVRMNGAFQVAQLRELIKERLFQRLLS